MAHRLRAVGHVGDVHLGGAAVDMTPVTAGGRSRRPADRSTARRCRRRQRWRTVRRTGCWPGAVALNASHIGVRSAIGRSRCIVSSDSWQTSSSHFGCWPVALARSHVWVVTSLTYIASTLGAGHRRPRQHDPAGEQVVVGPDVVDRVGCGKPVGLVVGVLDGGIAEQSRERTRRRRGRWLRRGGGRRRGGREGLSRRSCGTAMRGRYWSGRTPAMTGVAMSTAATKSGRGSRAALAALAALGKRMVFVVMSQVCATKPATL